MVCYCCDYHGSSSCKWLSLYLVAFASIKRTIERKFVSLPTNCVCFEVDISDRNQASGYYIRHGFGDSRETCSDTRDATSQCLWPTFLVRSSRFSPPYHPFHSLPGTFTAYKNWPIDKSVYFVYVLMSLLACSECFWDHLLLLDMGK